MYSRTLRRTVGLAALLALASAAGGPVADTDLDTGDCLAALQRESASGLLLRPQRDINVEVPRGNVKGQALTQSTSKAKAKADGHHGLEDFHDYGPDAQLWLKENPELRCDLPRVSLEHATRVFEDLIQEFHAQHPSEPFDPSPWATGKPRNDSPSPLERARYFLALRLFGGPGIVEGVTSHWPAMARWQEPNMVARLGDHHFKVTRFNYPDYVHTVSSTDYKSGMTFPEYLEKAYGSKGFFLFVNEPEQPDRGLNTTEEELGTMDLLRGDFQPHPRFATTPEEHHAILALDGLGSSHGFHIHGPVWQTQVVGRKAWWLLAPEVTGDVTVEEGNSREFLGPKSPLKNKRGAAPVVEGHTYKEPNSCAFLRKSTAPAGTRFCVAGPGETLLLPDMMWHGTCALDRHTASVGGWMMDRRADDPPGGEEEHRDQH